MQLRLSALQNLTFKTHINASLIYFITEISKAVQQLAMVCSSHSLNRQTFVKRASVVSGFRDFRPKLMCLLKNKKYEKPCNSPLQIKGVPRVLFKLFPKNPSPSLFDPSGNVAHILSGELVRVMFSHALFIVFPLLSVTFNCLKLIENT